MNQIISQSTHTKTSAASRLSLAVVLAALGASAAASVGCSSDEPKDGAAKIEVVQSAQQRNLTPTLSPTETDILANGEADFAIDILKQVSSSAEKANDNVFLSPHSISTALAMTYAGARGETAAEMKKALHFDLPDDRIHAGFDYLDLALQSRGKNATGKDAKPFRLNIANSLWGQQGSTFEPAFLDILAVNYGAGVNTVDFIHATEPARLAINGWVESKTENRIKELLRKDVIDDSTRFVLVNTVYFNASWASKFDPNSSTPGPFTKLDGSKIDVPMMQSDGISRPHMLTEELEAVELPYDGNELSMLVIMPAAGTYKTFESSLTGGKVLDILAGLKSEDIKLSLPKLKVEADFSLREPLEALGMKKAFTDGADFAISKSDPVSIAAVIHKTFLEVDENGTEAAAATAVVGKTTSVPIGEPKSMKVDRPFLTAIVDRQTKTLVFVGRILEPKQ